MPKTQNDSKEYDMFRRKEDGSEILDELPESENDNAAPAETTAPAFSASDTVRPVSASTAAPAAATSAPTFRPTPPAASSASAKPAASSQPVTTDSNMTSTSSSSTPSLSTSSTPKSSKRVLTVGPDIQMKGEITTCDRVVIEGAVDATLTDVHTVELAQSGSLKGTAEVEDAEISGIFEGELIVRGRLIIYSTGTIRGNVTYGEIEIERGGQLSGNVRNVDEANASSNKGSTQRRSAAAA